MTSVASRCAGSMKDRNSCTVARIRPSCSSVDRSEVAGRGGRFGPARFDPVAFWAADMSDPFWTGQRSAANPCAILKARERMHQTHPLQAVSAVAPKRVAIHRLRQKARLIVCHRARRHHAPRDPVACPPLQPSSVPRLWPRGPPGEPAPARGAAAAVLTEGRVDAAALRPLPARRRPRGPARRPMGAG